MTFDTRSISTTTSVLLILILIAGTQLASGQDRKDYRGDDHASESCRMVDDRLGWECRGDKRIHYVDFEPNLWYNRVDGIHLGLDRVASPTRFLRIGLGGGWNSALSGSDRWTWRAMARLHSVGTTAVFLQGGYRVQTSSRFGTTTRVSPLSNGLGMILGGDDYFDYYRSEGFLASTGIHFKENGIRLTGTFLQENHTSLARSTSYDFFNAGVLRNNPAIVEGRMQTASVSLEVSNRASEKYRRSFKGETEFTTTASDFDFQRYSLEARWQQQTFCRDCRRPAFLDLMIVAGTSTGTLPLQRSFVIDRRSTLFSDFGMLRSVSGIPFEGDKAVGFFWEHNFQNIGFDMLGFRSLGKGRLATACFWRPRSDLA